MIALEEWGLQAMEFALKIAGGAELESSVELKHESIKAITKSSLET